MDSSTCESCRTVMSSFGYWSWLIFVGWPALFIWLSAREERERWDRLDGRDLSGFFLTVGILPYILVSVASFAALGLTVVGL